MIRIRIAFTVANLLLLGNAASVRAWTSTTTPSSSSHKTTLAGSAPSHHSNEHTMDDDTISRRSLLQSVAAVTASASLGTVWMGSSIHPAYAADDEEPNLYQRQLPEKKIAYQISLPSHFQPGQKPLKTHLDEVNFISDSIKGYQYGITVDPVRIASLKEVRLWAASHDTLQYQGIAVPKEELMFRLASLVASIMCIGNK